MKIAIYAGSFDPITLGHLDIIRRSLDIFDKLIIGVGYNVRKQCSFSIDERIQMIKDSLEGERSQNFEVEVFDNLLVDFAKEKNAGFIIRGVRSFSDFDYELQMTMTNQSLSPDLETVFLLPKKEYMFVSSSLVRELAHFKKDFSSYVPESVIKMFNKKFNE